MAQQLGWHFGTCSTGHHNPIPRVDDLTKLDNPRVTIWFLVPRADDLTGLDNLPNREKSHTSKKKLWKKNKRNSTKQ